MNNLTRKRNWLITFLCTMALCLCFAFGITLNKPTVNADANVKTYTVKISDATTLSGADRGVMNMRAPASGATKIIFRYTVQATAGYAARIGMTCGDFRRANKYAYGLRYHYSTPADETAFASYITAGNTYEISYNIGQKDSNLTGMNTTVKVTDATGTESTLNYASWWGIGADGANNAYYDQGGARYFGLYYYRGNESSWDATLQVSCYDDLGNDLGVTYHGYADIEAGVVDNNQTLTSGADAYMAFGNMTNANGSWYTNHNAGLDQSRAKIMEVNDFLISKGAKDSVIKMYSTDGNNDRVTHGYSVGFRKDLPKAEVDAGAELVLRTYALNGNDYIKYGLVAPLDATTTPDNDSTVMKSIFNQSAYVQGTNYSAPGFVNVRVPNNYVKKLAIADGSVPGIQFAIHSKYTGEFYIDSISYITGAQATAVDTLIADINAIGTVTKESATAIANAREAYDALPAEAQVLVTNYATLTAAESALEALKVTVTVNYGTGSQTGKVFAGETFEITALENNGKIFLGWDNGTSVIAPNGQITVTEDLTLTAIWVDYTQTVGASIRLNNTVEQSGIRFETVLTKATYEAYGDYIKAIGTIVLPTDLVDEEFTLEDTDAPNNYVLEKANFEFGEDNALRLNAGLITINQANYQREFSARSYMIVNYGGEDVVIYGDYNADDNARSVYEVATLALQDSASYSANEIAILQGYVQTATPTGVEVVVSSKEIELWA